MTELEKLTEKALDMAIDAGAADARITLSTSVENSVSVLGSEVDKISSSSDNALDIQIFVDGRYGTFSTNMMREEHLYPFLKNAVESTRMLEEDPCRSLPDTELYFRGEERDLGQYDDVIESRGSAERIEIARSITEGISGTDDRLICVEANYGDLNDLTYIVDSRGFRGRSTSSFFSVTAECSVRGVGDERSEGYWYDASVKASAIDAAACGRMALERALDSVSPRPLPSGKYDIVLENTVSSKVVAPIMTAVSGPALQQNDSFLAGHVGRKVFGSNVSIVDRPHLYGYMGSRLYDQDGVATSDRDIIHDGIVESCFINTYYSKKMGIPATIEGPSVLMVNDCDKKCLSLDTILKKVDRCILVTGFNGGNYNQATGDFSYGIQGFLIEGGVRLHPVSEVNVTGNYIDLWNRLLAVGNDPRQGARWQIPSLAFGSVNVSGL